MSSNKPKSKRLFINHVDQYMGYNLGKFLSQCMVGASQDEGEEEEEEGKQEQDMGIARPKEGCYQIFATMKDKKAKVPEFVKELMNVDTREQFYEQLVECDMIVYDITSDPEQIEDAVWAVSQLAADVERLDSQKMFILISSVMTWAKTKPLDPDDPEIPFTEDDFRRRKPHPNFKEHLNAEKIVIKMGKKMKSKLVTYIVGSGFCYGGGENVFHSFFKMAWHNAPYLTIYGNGQNVLPTIHIKDLAQVIQNIVDGKPKTRYVIAKDDSNSLLEEIVKAISSALTTGKVKQQTKEEAQLNKDVDQFVLDQLLTSLRMEGNFIKENMRINWTAETGLVENINAIVKEYKVSRKLQPIRICILGPPASGKTSIARQLCEHYKLHHVKVKDVLDEAITALERSAARADVDTGEEEEEDDGKAADDAALLEEVNENKAENNGRLEQQYVIRFMREKLMSKPCRNQGFVLDGFPKTKEQAEELFTRDGEEEEEAEEEAAGDVTYNKLIMPEFLFSLEANDEFLKQRIMSLPESLVAGTHNTEEGLLRRLQAYHKANTEEDSVLNYFDEKEIYPIVCNVMQDKKPQNGATVERIKKEVGDSRNYGLTPVELEIIRKRDEEERLHRETYERAERERQENEEIMNRKIRQTEWTSRLEDVKREEYERLEAQSLPLRNYLMKHVMPVLTEGLMDCVKVKPEDPVDYLAEYIFRRNPQVD